MPKNESKKFRDKDATKERKRANKQHALELSKKREYISRFFQNMISGQDYNIKEVEKQILIVKNYISESISSVNTSTLSRRISSYSTLYNKLQEGIFREEITRFSILDLKTALLIADIEDIQKGLKEILRIKGKSYYLDEYNNTNDICLPDLEELYWQALTKKGREELRERITSRQIDFVNIFPISELETKVPNYYIKAEDVREHLIELIREGSTSKDFINFIQKFRIDNIGKIPEELDDFLETVGDSFLDAILLLGSKNDLFNGLRNLISDIIRFETGEGCERNIRDIKKTRYEYKNALTNGKKTPNKFQQEILDKLNNGKTNYKENEEIKELDEICREIDESRKILCEVVRNGSTLEDIRDQSEYLCNESTNDKIYCLEDLYNLLSCSFFNLCPEVLLLIATNKEINEGITVLENRIGHDESLVTDRDAALRMYKMARNSKNRGELKAMLNQRIRSDDIDEPKYAETFVSYFNHSYI